MSIYSWKLIKKTEWRFEIQETTFKDIVRFVHVTLEKVLNVKKNRLQIHKEYVQMDIVSIFDTKIPYYLIFMQTFFHP